MGGKIIFFKQKEIGNEQNKPKLSTIPFGVYFSFQQRQICLCPRS